MKCLLLILVLSSTVRCSSDTQSPGNVLAFTHPALSHVLAMLRLCEEVHQQYGHRITIVIAAQFATTVLQRNISAHMIISESLSKINYDEIVSNKTKVALRLKPPSKRVTMRELVCDHILQDTHLLHTLRQQSFDVAIIDNSKSRLCYSAIAYRLSIKFIHFGRPIYIPKLRILAHPSAFPCQPSWRIYKDRMTFIERANNVWCHMKHFYYATDDWPADVVRKFAPEMPQLTNSELEAETQIYLLDFDVLMDYHLPANPNMVFVGGLTTRPARALTGEVKTFIDSATNGAVVVSFGSIIVDLPENMMSKLRYMFNTLRKIRFIVQYGNKTYTTGNVMYMPWIPLNDLLGHPHTKALVTHCGNRAQFEALYHGIPMLGLPVMWDQPYNAQRMQRRGYGLYLDAASFSKEDLVDKMTVLLTNPKYRQNIMQASKIFRSRPETPVKRAAYWVDHVMKYGGLYLRSPAALMPYYEFLGLDIAYMVLAGIIMLNVSLILLIVFRVRLLSLIRLLSIRAINLLVSGTKCFIEARSLFIGNQQKCE